MKNNAELQKDIQDAIRWEPLLTAAEIGVTIENDVVSLTDVVDSYVKNLEAKNAAKKIMGAEALVEKIEVKFPSTWPKTTKEITNEVLTTLKSNWSVPKDKVTVKVEYESVTLEGEPHWNYQKVAAKSAVNYMMDIKGVTNNIKSESQDTIDKKDIEDVIAGSWLVDDSNINVSLSGTAVTLTGTVDSRLQKEVAARIAWNTPGIWHINN